MTRLNSCIHGAQRIPNLENELELYYIDSEAQDSIVDFLFEANYAYEEINLELENEIMYLEGQKIDLQIELNSFKRRNKILTGTSIAGALFTAFFIGFVIN